MSGDQLDIRAMCHWRRNTAGVQEFETHAAFHYGSVCPYDAIAAVLAGQPDPRDDVAEWRIPLPFPEGKPIMSLNDRYAHWAVRATRVEKIKALTRTAVREADVPVLGHVHVELHYRPKTNAIRDADNLVATLKPCIDALHQPDERSRWAGIVPGDDARYVSWSKPYIHRADKRLGPATWLILRSSTPAPPVVDHGEQLAVL